MGLMEMKFSKKAQERANRLRAIRQKLHEMASQQSFAARIGVSRSRYANWEHGEPIPTEAAQKIKAITPGIDGDYILWGDQEGLTVEVLKRLSDPTNRRN